MKTKVRVIDIAHPLAEDIAYGDRVDAKEFDVMVATCLTAASDSVKAKAPVGYGEFERDYFLDLFTCLRASHQSIRKLLADGHDSSSVDALVIARLQLETLYNVCFMLSDVENVRLFLKNGWKKQFIRFLLGREEWKHVPRASDYYSIEGPLALEKIRPRSFVTDDEKAWIEYEQLGVGIPPTKAEIPGFPSPGKVLDRIESGALPMLKRLYPEYQHLCSFAHGAHESVLFRVAGDRRSSMRHIVEPWKIFDLGQRQVAEPAIIISALSCVCVATELFAISPTNIELAAKLTTAWKILGKASSLAITTWDLRAKTALGVF